MSTTISSKNKFIMLCGLPGSGKTTLAKQLLDDNTVWVSSDNIREELFGSEEVQGEPSVVFEAMKKRTHKALGADKNVIYDACNVNSKYRIAMLNELKKYGCIKRCAISATPYRECIGRNASRDRVVREYVIKRMYMNWNTPYFYEGWDEIDIVFSAGARKSGGCIYEYAAKYMEYDQETPYHSKTLGAHMKAVGDSLVNQYGYDKCENLVVAGRIHDCGKPFTKAFVDSKGNACEVAHYYQHQCVGAYDSLFFDYDGKSDRDILEISCLIGLHMAPFQWKEPKTDAKWKRILGEDMYTKVMSLHSADLQA